MDLLQTRKKVDKLLIERGFATKQVILEKELLRTKKEKVKDVLYAQQILQINAELIQTQAHSQIASVVTKCLKTVFGHNSYSFKIEFKRARGKTEAKLIFLKNGEEFSPRDEECGGVIDVAALGLRLACLMLNRPRLRRLLILDEPMKNVNGEEYQERVANLIQILAEDHKVQFVLVSDDDWLKVGNVVEL